MNNAELSLFISRIQGITTEMGLNLQHSAISPNIRDRLDFSCAVFDSRGQLSAQAAHIPVHLGSMAYAMAGLVNSFDWSPGDAVITNNPFSGGTHLPDVTVITPVFRHHTLCGFLANRAHHADIGGTQPGSMPIAGNIHDEGLLIEPTRLMRDSRVITTALHGICARLRNPATGKADISSQLSANFTGLQRLQELIDQYGVSSFFAAQEQMNRYASELAVLALDAIPAGDWQFTDYMDDDGAGQADIPVTATLRKDGDAITVDFTGTANQVRGNINCPLPVTAAAVYYCFHCLMPAGTPACSGSLENIHIRAAPGSLVNAQYPAAVAAGNVETSTRIVDVVLGALGRAIPDKIPAASHGSMNNIAMGHDDWDYYETVGGGMGASRSGDGLHAVQTHMTNTMNTPIEILEMNYPLRIRRYAIRADSGGKGRYRGGNGLIRAYEFLSPAAVTLLTERRRHEPWGLAGGEPGCRGVNELNGTALPAKTTLQTAAGDVLTIYTGGGGGYGQATRPSPDA